MGTAPFCIYLRDGWYAHDITPLVKPNSLNSGVWGRAPAGPIWNGIFLDGCIRFPAVSFRILQVFPVFILQETPGPNEIHRPAGFGGNEISILVRAVTGTNPSSEIAYFFWRCVRKILQIPGHFPTALIPVFFLPVFQGFRTDVFVVNHREPPPLTVLPAPTVTPAFSTGASKP